MSSDMTQEQLKHISQEKFAFVNKGERLTDTKLQTRPVGFLEDALLRFVKNKGSVVCFAIIFALILYAIFAPIFSPYEISTRDGYYAYVTPRNNLFVKAGFWDGSKKMQVNNQQYEYFSHIPGAIMKDYGEVDHMVAKRVQKWHKIKVDTYAKVGWVKVLLTADEYADAKKYEEETGIQLFYPVIDTKKINNTSWKSDMNAWYLTDAKGNPVNLKGEMIKGANGKSAGDKVIDIYVKDPSTPDGNAYYMTRMNGNQYETRVLYREWYKYKNGRYASFLFGAEMNGYDIFTRLAYGARLSLLLSVIVSAVNLIIGIVIGALEGYYGGAFDLIVERIKDILYDVPSMLIFALFQLYLATKVGAIPSMFFAFIFYGWIGSSSTVRAQFYRFKGQDYVNASRTLGAKDGRLIFKHILPNSAGFIITASVLDIPGVILSESNLTYLGIVNLEGDAMTSVGTMLNAAKGAMTTSPHCLFFPAIFISILLVCFNEFGNGLRDAFNPQLRGAENA